MEPETIPKNGANPKSLMSRGNFKIFTALIFFAGIFVFNTCNKDKETNVSQKVIDKVNEAKEFDVKDVWERKEEIVNGTHTSETVGSDDRDDPKLRRFSEPDLPCFTYNVDWDCDSVKVSASENPDDFAMVDPLASVLWPGNLVQGESLASGVPESIPVTKRQPGNITLAIVSSGSEGATMYRTVDKMQFSNVNQAMNDILSEYKGQGFAKYSFEYNFIESEDDLKFVFNASFKGFGATAKAKLRISNNSTYKYVLVRLHQSYFTMVYDDPAGLDGVFTPDITVKDLENYTGNGNPICYISSVTYGRVYYVLYESTASRDSLSMALNAGFNRFGVDASANVNLDHISTMQKTTATVFQLGGDGEGAFTNAISLDLEAIQKFMDQGVNFSAKNVGAPISYTVKYLKNARTVRMNNTMEYTVQRCDSKMTTKRCPEFPELTTDAAMNVSARTATLGGNITNAGWPEYAERGVVYSSTIIPEIGKGDSEKRISIGMGTGSFTVNVSGLTPLTEYYARAYATNTEGTVYGDPVSFTTDKALPTLTTNSVTTFTARTATLGGNISFVGEPHYTERGVVYSSTGIPTTATGQKAPNIGIGEGSFNVNVSGLTPLTEYYARAYAINDEGTAYGDPPVSFTTPAALPVVSIDEPTNITTNSALVSGIITDAGKPEYTERGFCYNTLGNPEITGAGNVKIPVSGATSEFPYNITGLSENITYHVRAYAISTAGTGYSDEVRFTTGTALALATIEPGEIKATSAKLGVEITNAGNPPYTEIGVCYATTPNPATDNKKEIAGNKEGEFYTTVTGLTVNTMYYVRAYGINSEGTKYGKEVFFTTANGLPIVTTNNITSYTATTAILGGNIIDIGTPQYSERGVVYATTPSPTTANTKKIIAGAVQTGEFSERFTGLLPNIRYYVRAYAINTVGTTYGNEESFTTSNVPTLTTTAASNITPTSVRLGGNITNAGVPPNTERGVVYATTPNPTTANTKKASEYPGTTGSFTVDVDGLTPGSTYYVRAYAINAEGTYYGSTQVQFTTSDKYYRDDKGVIQERPASAIEVTPTAKFEGGWYYVPKNKPVTLSARTTFKGTVHLILEDGCIFTVTGGINLPDDGSQLIIYGQSTATNMGKLIAKGSANAAGIGGNKGSNCGTVTINGGNIEATGGDGSNGGNGTRNTDFLGFTSSWTGGNGGNGAGIGGGGGSGSTSWDSTNKGSTFGANGSGGGSGGVITINGGTVTATGGARGVGGNNVKNGGSGGGGGGQGAGIGGGGGGGHGAAGGGDHTQKGNDGQNAVALGKGGNGGDAYNGGGWSAGHAGGNAATYKKNGGTVKANGVVTQ